MPSLWDYVINEPLNKYSTNLALNRMQVNDIAHCNDHVIEFRRHDFHHQIVVGDDAYRNPLTVTIFDHLYITDTVLAHQFGRFQHGMVTLHHDDCTITNSPPGMI